MKFSTVKLPSNQKFGLFFTGIFLLASFYSYYIDSKIMVYVHGAISGIFLIITIINANALLPLNKLWMKFGILLGMIVSPIIMGLIFFGIFTPVGIFMRLFKRDNLCLSFEKKKTYWINCNSLQRFDFFKKQY